MLFGKVGGGVAAEGAGEVVPFLEVVLGAHEVAFHVVFGGVTAGIGLLGGSVDFLDFRGEETLGNSFQVAGLGVVVLMAQQDVHAVLAEHLVEGEGLGVVGAQAVALVLGQFTVDAYLGAVEGVVVVVIVGLSPVHVGGDVQAQPGSDFCICGEGSVELVAQGVVGVVLVGTQGVTCLQEGAGHRIVTAGYAVVVLLVAVGVGADGRVAVSVQVTDKDRVDGGNPGGVVHQVGGTQGGVHVGGGQGLGVHITHVAAQAQPLLHLVVCLEADRQALVAGVGDDTVVVEVTQAGVEGGLVGAAVHAHVVFLAHGLAIGIVGPAVRLQPVGLTGILVLEGIAQRGGGVQLAVHAHQLLAFRNGIDLVTQVLEHILVGLEVGLLHGHTTIIVVVVVEHGVGSLIVFGRVSDGVVVHDGAGVHTPAGIEVYDGIIVFGAPGGDQDDAGGAAGAVQGGGSGVLEDGDTFNIALGDIGKGSGVGGAVNNHQRIRTGIHGGDTADVDGTGTCTRSTGGASDLQTGHLAHQSVGDVGGLATLQVLRLDDGRGAGKGFPGGGAEGNHDGLVQEIGILFQDDVDDALAVHRDILA